MDKDLKQLFKNNERATPPLGLSDHIFRKIDECAQKEDRHDRYFWGVFLAFSLVAFIGSGVYAYHAFVASNFGNYLSVIFSDGGAAIGLWKELGLSLVESLPLLSVLAILGSVTILLWTVRKFTKESHPLLSNEATNA
ncbi:MAG: hypothetical protein KA052_00070 [Candidatus Pacebacteria bacterium]|nr:hypothetical protein [Candidatus Paceibacterota bacterium]